MGYRTDVIEIDKIPRKDMREFADHIEEYLELFEDCMVIPKGLPKMDKKMIKWGIAKVKELIKKLRKGDEDVFEDSEGFIMSQERLF